MAIRENRFKRVLIDGGGLSENRMEIYIDRKTGVNYLFSSCGNAGGMCVLVDKDGKPMVSPLPVED